MDELIVHKFLWDLKNQVSKLGAFGMLGLLILLSCSAFYVIKVLPLNQQVFITQQQMANFNSHKKIPEVPKQPVSDIKQDLLKFNQLLPRANMLHQSLRLIDTTAKKQHLMLNHGEYKLTNYKKSRIVSNPYISHYEIVLPITGQYAQIREFIATVLQQQPTLALKDIKFKRDNTMSATIEAKLIFVLFLQGTKL
jgi:Tfp pilus assembly protein PilO